MNVKLVQYNSENQNRTLLRFSPILEAEYASI
jgi:hypothetical protein